MPHSLATLLAVALAPPAHPSLLITPEDVPGVLERVERSADARAAYEALLGRADAWLTRALDFPDRGGQWWHWYNCTDCGVRLTTKSPTEHVCPNCGKVYTGYPYDDVVLSGRHQELAVAARDLGVAHLLTGRAECAAKAREILLGYAERYASYPLHDIHGQPKVGGAHVGPQTLDEAVWLIPIAQGFDCIRETLSPDDIATIADKLLLPAAKLIHDHQWGIHNICCWHASAYGLVGLALGDETLIHDAIDGPKGFRAQVSKGVLDDGLWYESAWGYHFYTMSALEPLAVAARNAGIDLYSEHYKRMYDASLAFMAPGGILPAFSDSGPASALGYGPSYEIAFARWGDPRHTLPVLAGKRASLQTLLFGRDLATVEDFRLGSSVFAASGYAILRSGPVGEGGVDARVPRNYVAFRYGPHGGGHGHPDKLSFVLYGNGELLAEDPGSIAYGNPAHAGWYRQTLGHNTIVVNGKSQHPCTGTLQFAAFGDGLALASARADAAYPGVRLRRTLALAGERLIDLVLCEADEESTFDWCYHNRGQFGTSVELGPLDKTPEGDGWKWTREPRSGTAEGPWWARWRTESGPTVTVAQAGSGAPRTIIAALGMGNPPTVHPPFVVSRTRGRAATYRSAVQWTRGDAANLTVEVLPVAPPEAAGAEKPLAVRVTDGTTEDIVFVNPGGGTIAAGGWRLEGTGALIHSEPGKPPELLTPEGSRVTLIP